MREKSKDSSSLFESIKEYVDLKAEYLQLSFTEKISLLVGRIVLMIFTAIFALAFLLLFLMLMYNVLLTWIGIPWIVSLIQLGLIILLIALMWIFKEKLVIQPVADMIVRILLDKNPKETEEEDFEDDE